MLKLPPLTASDSEPVRQGNESRILLGKKQHTERIASRCKCGDRNRIFAFLFPGIAPFRHERIERTWNKFSGGTLNYCWHSGSVRLLTILNRKCAFSCLGFVIRYNATQFRNCRSTHPTKYSLSRAGARAQCTFKTHVTAN